MSLSLSHSFTQYVAIAHVITVTVTRTLAQNHDVLCTEEFSKDQVEAVLAKEKERKEHKEHKKNEESEEREEREQRRVREERSDGSDGSDGRGRGRGYSTVESESSGRLDRHESNESDESDDEEDDAMDSEECALVEQLAQKLSMGCPPNLLSKEERRLLARVSHSAPARKLMKQAAGHKPYWDSPLNIEVRHHLHVEIYQIVDALCAGQVQKESPVLSSHSHEDDDCDTLHFQLLGLLMGYAVMMRTLNGDWANKSSDSVLQSDEDENCKNNEQNIANTALPSCMDAMSLLVQSTPFLESTFRPLSVDSVVQGWVLHRPPSLASMTMHQQEHCQHKVEASPISQATRAVLRDVQHILSSPELMLFALLDCWLLSRVCSSPTDLTDPTSAHSLPLPLHQCLQLACHPHSPSVSMPYAQDMTTLLISFRPIFAAAPSPPTRRKNGRSGSSNKWGVSQISDRFSRKCFFIINHVVSKMKYDNDEIDDQRSCVEWTQRLVRHLEVYNEETFEYR
jgi:hypothetical protein